MKKMEGFPIFIVSTTIVVIIILIGLVSVLQGVSTAYAMHIPPDIWPYPEVHDELEEVHDVSEEVHHGVLEHDLGIEVEDIEHISDNGVGDSEVDF